MLITKPALLIVDDDAAIRNTLTLIFVELGYSVRSASDGFAALALIHESMPDVLLLDLQMPGMSGFELLSVVRRIHPNIRVVATSGAFHGKAVPPGGFWIDTRDRLPSLPQHDHLHGRSDGRTSSERQSFGDSAGRGSCCLS